MKPFSHFFEDAAPYQQGRFQPIQSDFHRVGQYLLVSAGCDFVGDCAPLSIVASKTTIRAIKESMLAISNDEIYFELVCFVGGAVLYAKYSQILGSRKLGVIDLATVPFQSNKQDAPTQLKITPAVSGGKFHKSISPEIAEALRAAILDGKTLTLQGQMKPDFYRKVNECIELLGGKWNKKRKCHVFDSEARPIIVGALGDGRILKKKKLLQFFPTPPQIAREMVLLADIQPGNSVLEPSAGSGAILRELPDGITKTAVEIDPGMAEDIDGLADVRCADFLKCNGELGSFDRIIMNPPFTGGQDIAHIRHAATLLKPGGRLVAICSASGKSAAVLRPTAAYWKEIPANTFKESGTSVKTIMLVIERKNT